MTEEKHYYDSNEAVKYLADKWGIPSYSLAAFRQLRKRWRIEPDIAIGNGRGFTKETLDNIPKPDRSKPRPTRRKKPPGLALVA